MNYSFGYDTYGNNISMTYPTGLELVNVYDNNGYLTEIKKPDGYSIWKLNNLRATGMPSNYTLGYNTLNLDKQFNYNSFENLTEIKTGNWQQIYNFDDTTGNLMSRSYKDLTNPSTLKTETFQYDGLDRLRYAQVTGQQLQEINYNPSGNIISKSGLGNYTYDQSKTNSLLNVGNTEQLISSTAQNIQYNYHNKPDLITEGVLEYSLIYGADNQRIKSTLKNNSTEVRTMFYGPGYEKVVTPDSTWESCYISSPYGAEAMIVKKGTLERLYYIEKDHLGSIIGLISNTGSYVERHSYDSWGRRRNPTNWSFDNVPESKLTSWGYTGQEHLDMFGLINMNGRVYDPVLGRFLNVDPIIQNPYSSQGLNNYSYCINNPLRYIDPSGYTRSAVNASTITQPEDIIAFLNAYFSQGGNLPYAESQVSGWLPNTIWYDDQTRMVDFWVTVPGSYINVDDSEHESGFIPIKSITVSAIKVSVYLSILRNFSEIAFYRPNVTPSGEGFEDKRGIIISVANGVAAAGIIGIMADIGGVIDSRGNSSLYFTIGWAVGLGASGGLGVSGTSKNFDLTKFAGYSEGRLVSLPILGGERFNDYAKGTDIEYGGLNYTGLGVNVGVGLFGGGYHAYTFTSPVPPPDFWCRPCRHF